MDHPPALQVLLDRLVGHGLSPAGARAVLERAAGRKGLTVDLLVQQIMGPALAIEDLEHELRQVRAALESREVIGQAKGILMERHAIGADEAFARLRAMSQRSNVKLREVAEHLVELRASPMPRADIDAEP